MGQKALIFLWFFTHIAKLLSKGSYSFTKPPLIQEVVSFIARCQLWNYRDLICKLTKGEKYVTKFGLIIKKYVYCYVGYCTVLISIYNWPLNSTELNCSSLKCRCSSINTYTVFYSWLGVCRSRGPTICIDLYRFI